MSTFIWTRFSLIFKQFFCLLDLRNPMLVVILPAFMSPFFRRFFNRKISLGNLNLKLFLGFSSVKALLV